MKHIIAIVCFTLYLLTAVVAQPGKKPATPNTAGPSAADLKKIMDNLPPEQQAMVKEAIKNRNTANSVNAHANAKNDESAEDPFKEETRRIESIGTVTTKKIGQQGGNITSANGKITVDFPAGALKEDTEIGIEEVDNTAPLACGNGFRLSPTGLLLDKPAEIEITCTDWETSGTTTEFLGAITRNKNGKLIVLKSQSDKKTKKTKLTANELNEIAIVAFKKLSLIPSIATLARQQSLTLELRDFDTEMKKKKTGDPSLETSPVTKDLLALERDADFRIDSWQINGGSPGASGGKLGTLTSKGAFSAQYTAPKDIPLNDRVIEIGVKIIHNKSNKSFYISSKIFLVATTFFDAIYNGNMIRGTQALDPAQAATTLEQLKNNEKGIMLAGCTYLTKSTKIPTLIITLSNNNLDLDHVKSFLFAIENPREGVNIIKRNNSNDAAGGVYNKIPLGLVQYIRKLENGKCVETSSFEDEFKVTFSELNLRSGGTAIGTMSGILYNDEAEACKSSDPHPFTANFSLTVLPELFQPVKKKPSNDKKGGVGIW